MNWTQRSLAASIERWRNLDSSVYPAAVRTVRTPTPNAQRFPAMLFHCPPNAQPMRAQFTQSKHRMGTGKLAKTSLLFSRDCRLHPGSASDPRQEAASSSTEAALPANKLLGQNEPRIGRNVHDEPNTTRVNRDHPFQDHRLAHWPQRSCKECLVVGSNPESSAEYA
jgi:hypothetical protein